MKRALITLAKLAAFGVNAQESTAISGSASGADSTSTSGANSNAIGNINASQSQSGSQSGASSGSQSGALGNVLEMNNYAPEVQTILQDMHSTSENNVNYSGRVENVTSGHVVQDVRYSGSQTVKNVPGIAMSGPASGPCTGASGGLGLAGPGWGLGLNGSSVMADCRLRENTRVLGMAMQSIDGGANPQEKGELTVMFMEAARGLAAYNRQIIAEEVKPAKEAK